MSEQPEATPAQPAPVGVQITIRPDGAFDLQLLNCPPPEAVRLMLKAINAILFTQPAEQKPSLLVPNGRPLPNFRKDFRHK